MLSEEQGGGRRRPPPIACGRNLSLPFMVARPPRRDALDRHPAVAGLPHRIGHRGADEAWFDRVGGCGRSWTVSRKRRRPSTSGNNESIRDECLNLHGFETPAEARAIIEAWSMNAYNDSCPGFYKNNVAPAEFARRLVPGRVRLDPKRCNARSRSGVENPRRSRASGINAARCPEYPGGSLQPPSA